MAAELDIEIRGLHKQFAGRPVLRGVDLRFTAGETAVVIGPSGAGKSTLLRCLNGLCNFDAGEIRVMEHRLRPGLRPAPFAVLREVRRTLGMIFQDFQLFPHLTAMQNVMEAPRQVLGLSARQAARRAETLLDRVGLSDRAHAYPRELSGGQKQRVAIARALAMEPRGLLCDEITSALDPELKVEVLTVLEGLRNDGMTLIMVTHEPAFVRRLADRVIVLQGGRVTEDGLPADVFRGRYESVLAEPQAIPP